MPRLCLFLGRLEALRMDINKERVQPLQICLSEVRLLVKQARLVYSRLQPTLHKDNHF